MFNLKEVETVTSGIVIHYLFIYLFAWLFPTREIINVLDMADKELTNSVKAQTLQHLISESAKKPET